MTQAAADPVTHMGFACSSARYRCWMKTEALTGSSCGCGGLSSYLLRCAAAGITVEICGGLAPVSGQVSRPCLIAFLNEAVIFFESLRLCLQLVQMDCQPYNSAGDCRKKPRQAVIRQRGAGPVPAQ